MNLNRTTPKVFLVSDLPMPGDMVDFGGGEYGPVIEIDGPRAQDGRRLILIAVETDDRPLGAAFHYGRGDIEALGLLVAHATKEESARTPKAIIEPEW